MSESRFSGLKDSQDEMASRSHLNDQIGFMHIPHLNYPFFLHTDITPVPDNNVIRHRDLEQISRLDQLLRRINILRARRGIAGWMVMHKDD